MTDEDINNIYIMITDHYSRFLKNHGVKLPKLRHINGLYTKDALTLVYLSRNYPNTPIVSKTDLTNFVKQFYPDINDVQQARHLASQKGWYICSGTRNDNTSEELQNGQYKLKTLDEFYPGFTAERRDNKILEDWDLIKQSYDFMCACCGSKEGEPHRYMKNVITQLQKGHMNPSIPLEEGNIIPQCQICNRADRNYWIYDKKGRVVKIANAKAVDKCSYEVKKEIYKRLYKFFNGRNLENI